MCWKTVKTEHPKMATHFVMFYVATAGTNGGGLGSDEEDIVIMHYLVYDVLLSKVVTEQQYLVRPDTIDGTEGLLSEQCIQDYGLNDEHVKKNGQSLETVVDSFEAIVSKLSGGDNKRVALVTEGQLHVRQVLHPKATQRNLLLPDLYNSFYDIRKEFRSFYRNEESQTVREMAEYLNLGDDVEPDLATDSVRNMSKLIAKMLQDGHRFVLPETVTIRLEPGICTKGEEVDSGCVVRARGLPWQSSDLDIAKFFRGLNIAKGGVALCLSPQGRRNGEALVRFVNLEHRDMALKRHKHHIGSRYIEVYKATGDDFISVAGGNNNEAQQFLSRGGQVIIRMRGLPYECTAKQVYEFFESGDNGCMILDGEDGVLFVRKPDGRATGDAFVLFATEDDSTRALAKHREIIGSRYIELFRSTTAEVQQVLNRSMDPRTYEQPQQPLIAQVPALPLFPQHVITSGTRKDCIRLRGLPYEAQVEHILEFLGEHANSIVKQGVHMVYNPQGQPSGEAFIQTYNEHSAFLAAQQRHHRYMVFGKKQRYIEVFQCSGEDMNVVLSGGLPMTPRPILSPGMFMWDNGMAAAAAAGLPPGHHPPALMPPGAPRMSIPCALPQSMPQPPHPAMFPVLPSSSIKQQSDIPLLLHSHLLPQHMRTALPPPHPAISEAPHASQAHPASLITSMKTHLTASSFHPSMLGQYGEVPVAAPVSSGMILIPQGAKFANNPYHTSAAAMHPQMMMAVSTTQTTQELGGASTTFQQQQKQFLTPPLLPMPYPNAMNAAMTNIRLPSPAVTANKRTFEQAFPGDGAGGVRGGIKRSPTTSVLNRNSPLTRPPVNRSHVSTPHVTTPQISTHVNHLINPSQLTASIVSHVPGTPTHLPPPSINPQSINSVLTPSSLNHPTMNLPLLHTFYPPPPIFPTV